MWPLEELGPGRRRLWLRQTLDRPDQGDGA
jgi:hypothetical protein